ncbi:hypothetical protein JOB18_000420 [Solea senegalensis]|uniref:Uncharacterized protein n=1 Tax=Solea senegalensis TaxID=28829 RepID=A0AAV6PTX8_SOLSE|nr:hypothetical protein JOB18_000420 [Solea senegalensis]
MVWRWTQKRQRPDSLRTQMSTTDGSHLGSQSQHWSCIMGLEGWTAALICSYQLLLFLCSLPRCPVNLKWSR